jgi:hypothetical protein
MHLFPFLIARYVPELRDIILFIINGLQIETRANYSIYWIFSNKLDLGWTGLVFSRFWTRGRIPYIIDRRASGLALIERLFIAVLPSLWLGLTAPFPDVPYPPPEKKTFVILKEIHAEVKEMGLYPGQDFFHQAFFVGEDDDDTNKDIHVSILIRAREQKDKMTIRVTRMQKDRRNPQARLAGTTKEMACLVGGDDLEIQSSDYTEKEIAELVPEILTAIRNKKRLLKLGSNW